MNGICSIDSNWNQTGARFQMKKELIYCIMQSFAKHRIYEWGSFYIYELEM